MFCLIARPLLGAGPEAAPLREALPVLQSGYVDFARLQVRPDDRLETLAARSGGGIVVGPAEAAKAPDPAPMMAALLPDGVVYCRAASFRPAASWEDLAGQLDKWVGQGAEGAVIDVRSNGTPQDFEGAAHLAGIFTPAGTPLFSLRDARGGLHAYASLAPGASGRALPVPLMVLTDGRTAGAAEGLAAALRLHGALILGQATSGQGGSFADQTLSSGRLLHYLAAEVLLPDGTSLWGHPVEPDIGVTADARKQDLALALIGQQHVADVIGEAALRHRMSEASLVRDEDPEIAAALTTGPSAPSSPLLQQDIVLVDALDSLEAIRFSQRAEAPAPNQPTAR